MTSALSTVLLGRERAPRLVLRFALFTTLGLTIAGAVIVASVRHAYTVEGEQHAIDRARLTAAAVLQHQLRPGDLTRRLPAARRRELDRLFSRRVLGNGTIGAALYDTDAVATYAIGTARSPVQGSAGGPVRAALGGKVTSRVGSAPSGSGRVLDTYVPVLVGNRGTRGVVALEQDYAPIAAAAWHSSLVIAAVLEGVLLGLFVFLLPMLARASARIRKQVDALHELATHDELTGLENRVGFRRGLERFSSGPARTGAVMLVDLEGFRTINDTLGPERGDALLIRVAERLRSVDGPHSLARLGEDEFGLLLADSVDVDRVAQNVRDAFAHPFNAGGQRVAVDVRIGCALVPEHGTDPVVLLRRAGVALSLAKETRARLETYDPSHDASDVSRLTMTAELQEALRDGQLVVHYQPQADLATHAVRGAEALVRWEHPRRGLLTAAEFIGLAEQTELIGELGTFVLESAARQWQQWHALGVTIDIAVNLTALDLLDPHLTEEIEALTARHGPPPEYLVLEITERALLRDERHTKRVLDRLDRIGVRLAIDDYGTGYSSLAYLRDLPAQQVKLDRSFTAGVPGHPASEAIVRSTIELAHTLGATVVAEGVETMEQWEYLAAHGCDIAQGYLIGRPQPAEELTPKLTSKRPLSLVAA